ncbi:unnamed protein product [Caenorhabditis auriculariae]|uniref:VWFA domain-containing protein n=1 Tax=Caenorhabditis auriculariae TaxID=2777116 RepID=A0A8S1HE28_9PELO|nr:unnamed protein product [Caenorhabditis auriculariae]
MAAFGVELSFGVRNIQFHPSFTGVRASIQTLQSNDDIFVELSQTEPVYGSTDVFFNHKCQLNFRFEKLQRVKILVLAVDQRSSRNPVGIYGECQFDLSVVFASGGTLSLPLAGTSSLVDVTVTVPEFYSQYLKMRFSGSHIHSPDGLPLALYFVLVLPTGPRNLLLYKSDVVKDDKNPQWAAFSIPLYILHFYNECSIQLRVFNQNVNHPDSYVGYITTTLTQIQRGAGTFNSYMLMHDNGHRIGEKTSVDLRLLELENGPTIFEMWRNKTNFHVTAAVDFTASNGSIVEESSLHYIHPHRPSPYLKAILDVIPPLLAYMPNPNSPRIGALGFGAQVNVGNKVQLSNCFFLNSTTTDHQVLGLNGLLDAYRRTSMSAKLFGPTDFSETIYFVSKFAKAESKKRLGLYFVLLILSDGGPANPKRTIDAIVDASPHPMSIVAIGVGEKRNFGPMKALESPVLKHSDGRPLARQNYIFVESSNLQDTDSLGLLTLQAVQWKRQFDSSPLSF